MRRFDELFETFPADTPLAEPGEKPANIFILIFFNVLDFFFIFSFFVNLSIQNIATYHVAYALVRAALKDAMDDDGDDDGIDEMKHPES